MISLRSYNFPKETDYSDLLLCWQQVVTSEMVNTEKGQVHCKVRLPPNNTDLIFLTSHLEILPLVYTRCQGWTERMSPSAPPHSSAHQAGCHQHNQFCLGIIFVMHLIFTRSSLHKYSLSSTVQHFI